MSVPTCRAWVDLPPEIKKSIIGLLCYKGTLAPAPKGQLRDHDDSLNDEYFNNLLLVSKNFITPAELLFETFSNTTLRFKSSDELQKMISTVNSEVLKNLKELELHRIGLPPYNFDHFDTAFFKDLVSSPQTIMTQFPRLKKVVVTMDGWCGNIASFDDLDLRYVYSCQPADNIAILLARVFPSPLLQTARFSGNTRPKIEHLVTGVIAKREGFRPGLARFPFLRPTSWLRSLILASEQSDFEVVLKFNLCISWQAPDTLSGNWTGPDGAFKDLFVEDPCFNARFRLEFHRFGRPTHGHQPQSYRLHIPAEMSTRDWLLRTEWQGEKYQCHQNLAYEMIHADQNKSDSEWMQMLTDLAGLRL